MRISDWSSDVCSSDLPAVIRLGQAQLGIARKPHPVAPDGEAAVGVAIVQHDQRIGSGARQGYAHAPFAGGRNLALDADDLLAAFEELGRIRPIGLEPEIADTILESVHMHARGGLDRKSTS